MQKTWLCVISILGMAVCSAALVMLVPSFFGPGEQPSAWLVGTLAVLILVLAAGARYWRPSPSGPHDI
ncbi:hypothetical protein [Nocardiopsis ganjiahuensis]|uniref:hypothetical protein n=1 Tax=Nocardiopsis ganjiahuensis TaxID=239984 RepID=UPI00034CC49F|nr:hypothetical protein [Nocardiopsis ganjiahuensis]